MVREPMDQEPQAEYLKENMVMDVTTTSIGEDPSTLGDSTTEEEMNVVVEDTADDKKRDDMDPEKMSLEPVEDLGGDKGPNPKLGESLPPGCLFARGRRKGKL